jgi:tetratricopeptide (TPR) repeat protein
MLSCSTKKDTFINRNYHSIATKYNVLYNGKEAFKLGLEQLNSNYQDNYWEQLPIEPLKVDVLALPGMKADADNSPQEFEKAEEKAVKAIQMHSMVVARQERNNQIDDAYLLLGKARYYSKRFVPALEAFNFVIYNYPNASLMNETRIWQAKTQIRLQNEEQAIDNLKTLLENDDLPSEIKEAAHTAIAMAYTQADSIQQVVKHLNKAVETAVNKEQTARNYFVLGQLYRQKQAIDSSNIAFQKVIDLKKAPYKYKIHAHIEKAKNVSNQNEATATIEVLNKLIKDRDNRPYLGELYYQLGNLQKSLDLELAIINFKNSLSSKDVPTIQKELSFEAVGNLYFDKAQFLTAGSYYDSVLQITESENSKRVRRLARKRANLNEVILYENTAKVTDSILNIVAMSKEDQAAYFTTYIEKLKSQEEKQQQKINTGSQIESANKIENTSGKWYFYNVQTVGFGAQEFRKIWGNRPLEDNWRLSEKTQLVINETNQFTNQNNLQITDSEKYNLDFYLNRIPTNTLLIDSIRTDRNNAYYKLGIIYKEQFKEVELAINKLEKVLTFNPDKSIELPAKYHLYKIYSSQNNEKAETLKNDIITNFSTSKYAKIITNPSEFLVEDDENSPENVYAEVYYEYKEEQFESVIQKATNAISRFEGQEIVPKFELLKAYAIGKKDGLIAFKQALDFVAMNYPNTEEGKKALEVIDTIKTKI